MKLKQMPHELKIWKLKLLPWTGSYEWQAFFLTFILCLSLFSECFLLKCIHFESESWRSKILTIYYYLSKALRILLIAPGKSICCSHKWQWRENLDIEKAALAEIDHCKKHKISEELLAFHICYVQLEIDRWWKSLMEKIGFAQSDFVCTVSWLTITLL